LSNPVRVAPQQERSTRRLAGFLDAVAELFVEVGYEAATTTAVAERIGSSIGALYNYFPDKQSIAFTLVNQYSQEVEAHWKPLMEHQNHRYLVLFVLKVIYPVFKWDSGAAERDATRAIHEPSSKGGYLPPAETQSTAVCR
jgi:AcrR family transcriptional regulator